MIIKIEQITDKEEENKYDGSAVGSAGEGVIGAV